MIVEKTDGALTKLFGKSWRTSLSSIITAVAVFIYSNPEMVHSEWTKRIAGFIAGGGLVALGFNAKDKQVTGISGINSQSSSELSSQLGAQQTGNVQSVASQPPRSEEDFGNR